MNGPCTFEPRRHFRWSISGIGTLIALVGAYCAGLVTSRELLAAKNAELARIERERARIQRLLDVAEMKLERRSLEAEQFRITNEMQGIPIEWLPQNESVIRSSDGELQ